jgi:pimeloyl-ACP methyl ester carboxylesterase
MPRRVVALIAAVALLVSGPAFGVPAAGARTVLLVHGYHGSVEGWSTMQARLRGAGIPSIAVRLPGEDNLVNAAVIRGLVDTIVRGRGPDATVDIVAHSMGGLSARWYARFLGGAPADGPARIAHYGATSRPLSVNASDPAPEGGWIPEARAPARTLGSPRSCAAAFHETKIGRPRTVRLAAAWRGMYAPVAPFPSLRPASPSVRGP